MYPIKCSNVLQYILQKNSAVYIELIFGKSINSTLLTLAVGKLKNTGLFNLGMATTLGERKLRIQTCKMPLKIHVVLYPTCAKDLGNIYIYIYNPWKYSLRVKIKVNNPRRM